MKRIILTNSEGTQEFKFLRELFAKDEYCELHKYRIQRAIGKGEVYEAHGVKVERINK